MVPRVSRESPAGRGGRLSPAEPSPRRRATVNPRTTPHPLLPLPILVILALSAARGPAPALATRHDAAALDSLRGRVVWVDFWASWCVPCRKSFPWMKTMAERYGPQGFSV